MSVLKIVHDYEVVFHYKLNKKIGEAEVIWHCSKSKELNKKYYGLIKKNAFDFCLEEARQTESATGKYREGYDHEESFDSVFSKLLDEVLMLFYEFRKEHKIEHNFDIFNEMIRSKNK